PWHMWGGISWNFAASTFTDPVQPHPRGPASYMVLIKFRRNDENPFDEVAGLGEKDFIGDSELILSNSASTAGEVIAGPDGRPIGGGEILANAQGRAGGLRVVVPNAAGMRDAYRVAQSAFNRIAMEVASHLGIPLRRASVLLIRLDESQREFAVARPIGYPNVPLQLRPAIPLAMARLYSNYAEALGCNSPFFAFLGFFALVESLNAALRGRLRRFHHFASIRFEEPAESLTANDVKHIGRFMSGTSYDALLSEARPQRIAIAHFLMELSSRPLNVVAEDRIAFYRDLLKVAARTLLEATEANVTRLVEAGVRERTITTVFEGRFFEMSRLVSVLDQRAGQVRPSPCSTSSAWPCR
ncbi:MAG: hypothetical protein M3N13_02575, partial [Candidatus Eremiobacteraeota bacterium]|nr:hypothetical protein [Candidatus Eremiobacteraeota bacterium]